MSMEAFLVKIVWLVRAVSLMLRCQALNWCILSPDSIEILKMYVREAEMLRERVRHRKDVRMR